MEPPLSGPICDILWGDPLREEVLGKRLSDKDYKEVLSSHYPSFFYFCASLLAIVYIIFFLLFQFLEIDYLSNPARGVSCFYGYAAVAPVLKDCEVLGLVRAHECKEEVCHMTSM